VSTESLSLTETEWKLPSPRVVGMILVILTETALFTIFVVAYLFYIGKSTSGPYPHEVLELPILGTVNLRRSSHDQHEPVRVDFLFAGWFARQPRRSGPDPDFSNTDHEPNRTHQTLSPRAYHYDLLVLALRRRGLGGCFHRGVHHRRQLLSV
jgi:hypothetical protein